MKKYLTALLAAAMFVVAVPAQAAPDKTRIQRLENTVRRLQAEIDLLTAQLDVTNTNILFLVSCFNAAPESSYISNGGVEFVTTQGTPTGTWLAFLAPACVDTGASTAHRPVHFN
jgi:PBP1b-binding outer membrane lipoprotein LpoB